MNEIKHYCDQVDFDLSQTEIKHLGWEEDKEWIIESIVLVFAVATILLLVFSG
ncbi:MULTISPECIES: hypothetical protein [Vibrio]|uniref:hypothetical protein n=1 Tax=Vibrio TaxID=662 RepID=UPI00142EE8F2|nr:MULTISPECIES: hypothetical protein [Vibrio]